MLTGKSFLVLFFKKEHASLPMSAQVPAATAHYVPELDGLRAVAVSLVVLAHYGLAAYLPGGFGVTLFFFLSGYLITTLFYAEHASNLRISIARFYLRRWLRLTPPLLISIVLAVVFHGIFRVTVGGTPVPAGAAVAALCYYTNYYDLAWDLDPTRVAPFGICWSLAVEEHFYFVWPWIMRRAVRDPRRLALSVALLCAAVLVWRCVARFALSAPADYTGLATDCRIDALLYGALLRVLFETEWASPVVRLMRTRLCRSVAALALMMAFIIRDENFRETVRYSLQGLALMPCFTAVVSDDPRSVARRALSAAPMVFIGRLSYAIYLFHMMARAPGKIYFGSAHQVSAVVSGLVLTAAMSCAVFICVERPMARLRRRFQSHGPITGVAPSQDHAPTPSMTGMPRKARFGV
jgi:peptidoglycan/LPS O-acetylase OafA/YrhL